MGKGARRWLRYLNREGLVLLLRDLTLEGDTLKEKLQDSETALETERAQAAGNANARETAEPEGEPVMIEEIYGWKPENDAFGPDDEWNERKNEPSKTDGPTEGRAE